MDELQDKVTELVNASTSMVYRAIRAAEEDFLAVPRVIKTSEEAFTRGKELAEEDTAGKLFPEAYASFYRHQYEVLREAYDKGYVKGVAEMRTAFISLANRGPSALTKE